MDDVQVLNLTRLAAIHNMRKATSGPFFQPTTQPTIRVALCVLRVFWQSPRSCVVKPNRAALSRQRSRVRVSSSPPFPQRTRLAFPMQERGVQPAYHQFRLAKGCCRTANFEFARNFAGKFSTLG